MSIVTFDGADWINFIGIIFTLIVTIVLSIRNRQHADRLFERANFPKLHLEPDITPHYSEPDGSGFLKCTNVRLNITNMSSSAAAANVEGRIAIIRQHNLVFWRRSSFTFATRREAVLYPGSRIVVVWQREKSPCVEHHIIEELPFLLERVQQTGNLFRVPDGAKFILRFEVTYKAGAYGVSKTFHEHVETRLTPIVRDTEHGKDILMGWDIG